MVLLDLQGLPAGRRGGARFESNLSLSCTPESNVSQVMCDDDPDYSGVSVALCVR